ncbi:hypothetical protein Q8A67_005587 [Cirrhinus molitorella]|uniref:Ig-like domain-containing protein n=1 Tax=Cirrhinus molitorella TaxID=172907 RepID=A0AA88Q3M8_9TELE|nr:hypothetical protein Q8A67_005587 [Cirrhinus molitorella]
MKFVFFFIYVPFVYSELHNFTTTYTEMNGQMVAEIPEISSVTVLDGQPIDFYDAEIKKLIPRQDWMKEFASGGRFKEYTEFRERLQRTNEISIHVLMERFNQTHGVHTYQRMYGCDWDDETGDSHGFDEHAYDGKNFISLDMKELRYIAYVPQGLPTTTKWNNNKTQLEFVNQYYRHDCVGWIHRLLTLRKTNLETKGILEVSLLQMDRSSPVLCHATGFYPSAVTITWLRNGQNYDEDVDLRETLPNEDGTFQKTSTLTVPPDEWEKDQFVCVVEHMGRTIRKILTECKMKNSAEWCFYGCVFYS